MRVKWVLIGFGILYLAVLSCDENIRVDQDHLKVSPSPTARLSLGPKICLGCQKLTDLT